MTLIEIIVVLVLLGLVAVMGAPKIANLFKVSLQSTLREISSTYHEAYQAALASGKTYRIAFDLTREEYWIEEGPADLLLDTEKTIEKREERERFKSDQEKAELATQREQFHLARTITRSKRTLPYRGNFLQLERPQQKEPQTTGLAFIHLFPDGTSENAAIQVEDGDDNRMTLHFEALLGKTRARNGLQSLKDLEDSLHEK